MEEQLYYVTSLSLGQYHGALVCNDMTTNSEFVPLLGFEEIFEALIEYLRETSNKAFDH